jgi:plastocyanin
MRLVHFSIACFTIFSLPYWLNAGPAGNTLVGIVSWKGAPGKPKPLDLSKDPECAKLRAADPLFNESVVAGAGNMLANVVVYISAGEPDAPATEAPAKAVTFDQQGCHYTTHVLPLQVGQEIKISNSDPVAHSIHPVAKTNREWNHLQPPGTPPFSYSYDKEEFIPVKCNIHPWMQGFFVVLRTSHFAVTGENGLFRLTDLPPGKYTVTAWHESLGTQSQEVTLTENESRSIYFTFDAKQ